MYTSFEYLYTCILITFLLFHSACHESLASQQLIRANSKNIENRQRNLTGKKIAGNFVRRTDEVAGQSVCQLRIFNSRTD